MSPLESNAHRVLYLLVCAAPPAKQTDEVAPFLQEAGWTVCILATPQASRWLNLPALQEATGYAVRTDYKLPGEADPLPKADAMLLMPATFNTINKWAQGISDTLVTGILCEALGRGTPPILAVPCLKMDLIRHPVFLRSVAFLHECGIRILHDPEHYPSPSMVPLQQVIETLNEMIEERN